MKEVKIDLEVITPMFLHGANSTKAELRSPSIKGVMRYWWRAAKSEDDIDKLKKEEACIFGSTDKRSKVSIIVSQRPDLNQIRTGLRFDTNTGLGYLFPPVFIGGTSSLEPKQYFDAGTKFSITISAQKNNIEQLKHAVASVWLMTFFGGLGARSRRGGGNLMVSSIDDISELGIQLNFINNTFKTASDLLRWLKSNYNEVCKIINPSSGTDKYSNLCGARLKISKESKNTWKESLEEIGNIYKEHRREFRLDKRSAMGLPIGGLKVRGGKGQTEVRSASRLIFKVLKINNAFYSLIIYLKGPILPEDYKIDVHRIGITKLPDDKIIDQFLNNKLQGWPEVQL